MTILEFLLRYTVITGTIIAIVGAGICMMAKSVTLAKRKQTELNKKDRLYTTLMLTGIAFILVGMIIIALPIRASFYRG